MADATITATVSRTSLALADLNINDHVNYILSAQFLGAGVTYRRQQVRSPYTEGAVTVNRTRDVIQDQVSIDVLASNYTTFQANIATLQAAFAQDVFTLTVTTNGVPWAWTCEASDYKMDWSVPRIMGLYGQVQYTILRQPIPISGPAV